MTRNTARWLWIPAGLGAAVMLFGAVAGCSPEAEEKSRARVSIGMCWDDQKRKSFDAATQQFVAGACEMMENKFTQKYGHRP